MGSFYAAWTFACEEAAVFVENHVMSFERPSEGLLELASKGTQEAAFRRPALLIGILGSLDVQLPQDLSAIEMYVLAISGQLTGAPEVRHYQDLANGLQRLGVNPSVTVNSIYGEELNTLPIQCGSHSFADAWRSIAGPATSRTGWLPFESLGERLADLSALEVTGDDAANEGLLDLRLLLQTGIDRHHDILILAD